MSQLIKISESELSEIKMLQGKFQESIFKLGNLQIEKMELDRMVTEFLETEKTLKEEWNSLQKLEGGVIDKLINKYGEGGLNPSTGEYTPTNPIPKTV